MAWRLNNFLCCFKLETGGYVIGALQLLLSLLTLILSIIGLVGGIAIIDDPKTKPEDVSEMKTIITFLIIIIVSSVLNCIVAIFLIVGTNKRNLRYILVWLIVTFISTLLSLLSNIASFNIYSWVIFAISIYLYLCIYSLYVKIKEEQTLVASGSA